MHALLAELLAEATTSPAILGHHYEHAGQLHDAAEQLSAAGDEAVHQLDDGGACALYNRALGAARRLMLADDEAKTRSLFVATSVKLADALRVAGEVGLARGVVEEARAYGHGSKVLEAQLMRASSHVHLSEDNPVGALAAAREAIGLSITTGQIDLLTELYLDLATMLLRAGNPQLAVAELEEGINLLTLGDGGHAQSGPPGLWRLLLRLGQLNDTAGRRSEAIVIGEDALRHAQRVKSTLGAARAHSFLARLYEAAGNLPKANRYRREAVEGMRRLGDRRGTAELLLAGTSPTTTMMRISPSTIREARELAEEIGWVEGTELARRTLA
jgi:tetratricopeptide (TPR) repeat protein